MSALNGKKPSAINPAQQKKEMENNGSVRGNQHCESECAIEFTKIDNLSRPIFGATILRLAD
jgi:hypothetical protein